MNLNVPVLVLLRLALSAREFKIRRAGHQQVMAARINDNCQWHLRDAGPRSLLPQLISAASSGTARVTEPVVPGRCHWCMACARRLVAALLFLAVSTATDVNSFADLESAVDGSTSDINLVASMVFENTLYIDQSTLTIESTAGMTIMVDSSSAGSFDLLSFSSAVHGFYKNVLILRERGP